MGILDRVKVPCAANPHKDAVPGIPLFSNAVEHHMIDPYIQMMPCPVLFHTPVINQRCTPDIVKPPRDPESVYYYINIQRRQSRRIYMGSYILCKRRGLVCNFLVGHPARRCRRKDPTGTGKVVV